MKKCFIKIILFFIFILILINLINLINLQKKNNIVENFDLGDTIIDNLDNKINVELTNKINNLIDDISDTSPQSLTNKIENLYDRTKNLYDNINNTKNDCENKFDLDFSNIVGNYNSHKDKKCLKNISDILDAKHNLSSCSKLCNNNINCMSFSYDKNTNDCRLSTICHPDTNTTFTKNYSNTLYVKKDNNQVIKNYKLNKNQQCNNLCHNDIIDSSSKNTVHDCANNCENNNDCVSFEYNFTDKICDLRSECKQGAHIEDSNEYNCDTGQIKNGKIINSFNYDVNRNKNSNNNELDYYSMHDLKKKCANSCSNNVNCNAFTYEFTDVDNNCSLYEKLEIEKNISKKFKNICKKPDKIIKKNLYTKKISADNAEKQAQLSSNNKCEALCENNVNDSIPYIKFFKNKNDANYSYITFTDMYNVKEIEGFNLMDYKFIEIKMGYKVLFQNNENNVSIEREFQNPDEYNVGIDKLKQTIINDNDTDPWRQKINVIKIIKLKNDCRGKMSQCEYDSSSNTFKKEFKLFYGDDDDKRYCYDLAIKAYGTSAEVMEALAPFKSFQECFDDVPCYGYWSECIPDPQGIYKKQWIELRPPNGNGNCKDKYNNYIYSNGLSGCGSGANEGYNNTNILVNCNPNNDDNDDYGPFLIDGSYFESNGSNSYIYRNGSGSGSGIGSGSGSGSDNINRIGVKNFGTSTNSQNLCERIQWTGT